MARGNPCTVSLLSEPVENPPTDVPHTQCASWRRDDEVIEVLCWTVSGKPISLCGHGLLCTAVAWLRAGFEVTSLEMNGIPVAFQAEDDLAWIGIPPITTTPCAIPTWIPEFFPDSPWRAATAGGDNGYLVLEWPSGFDLTLLPVPDYGLRRRTGQAIIATTLDRYNPALDVHLRYFAPQHGVPEDTATGSAMRVLATYWMNRELNDGLHAFQCSDAGGFLRSRQRGELTWIGGRVTTDEFGDLDVYRSIA